MNCIHKNCKNAPLEGKYVCQYHAQEIDKLIRPNAPEEIQHKITLKRNDGQTETAVITRKTIDPSHKLKLISNKFELTTTGKHYFDSFFKMRLILAKEDYYPQCYGACIDIWATGFCISIGDGSIAYRLTTSTDPSQKIYDIFACGEDIEAVHPDKQQDFAKKWFQKKQIS